MVEFQREKENISSYKLELIKSDYLSVSFLKKSAKYKLIAYIL